MGIFGIPLAKFNSLAGLTYIIILASIVIGVLYWSFSQINNSSLPKNKKKKSKNVKSS